MLALEQQQFKSDDEVQPWHWPDQHPVTCVGPGNGGGEGGENFFSPRRLLKLVEVNNAESCWLLHRAVTEQCDFRNVVKRSERS